MASNWHFAPSAGAELAARYRGEKAQGVSQLLTAKGNRASALNQVAGRNYQLAGQYDEQAYGRRQTSIANLMGALQMTGQAMTQKVEQQKAKRAANDRNWLGQTGGDSAGLGTILPIAGMAAGAGIGGIAAAGAAGGLTGLQGALIGGAVGGSVGSGLGATFQGNPNGVSQGYNSALNTYMGYTNWQNEQYTHQSDMILGQDLVGVGGYGNGFTYAPAGSQPY